MPATGCGPGVCAARAAAAPVPAIKAVDPRSLDLPCSTEPLVSVIIPTYGQLPYTLRCLASIAAHAPDLPIEVIVIDDAWAGAGRRRPWISCAASD